MLLKELKAMARIRVTGEAPDYLLAA